MSLPSACKAPPPVLPVLFYLILQFSAQVVPPHWGPDNLQLKQGLAPSFSSIESPWHTWAISPLLWWALKNQVFAILKDLKYSIKIRVFVYFLLSSGLWTLKAGLANRLTGQIQANACFSTANKLKIVFIFLNYEKYSKEEYFMTCANFLEFKFPYP